MHAVPGCCAITLKKALPSAPSASWAMADAASALGCQKEKLVPTGCPLTVGLGSTRRRPVGLPALPSGGSASCESPEVQP